MTISLKGRNFFALEDFTPEEVQYLLDLATRLKEESREHIKHRDYIREDFLLLFGMDSTRTRCAFETSASDLGMGTTFLSNSHLGNTETIKDPMRVFSETYSAIGYGGAKHSTLLEMAKDSAIPIINGYTDHQHLAQMLASAMTLDEVWGRENYKGETLCFIGRGDAVNSSSYGVMCAMLDMSFTYITSYIEMDEALEGLTATEKATFRKFVPEGVISPNWDTEMDTRRHKVVKGLFAKYSPQCKFIETDDINAIEGVDMITTEDWGFLTDPVETWLPGIVRFRPYRVNGGLLERTEDPDRTVIHILPSIHNMNHTSGQKLLSVIKDPDLREFPKGGMEATDEVFEQDAAYIFQETGDRRRTTKTIIKAVLGKRWRRN